jgi:chemotaxis protein methyltransferase CheR
MAELGIVDIREINKVIKSLFDYDFSNHALTSYKQRIERIMHLFTISSAEGLIRRFHDDKNFFDLFLHELFVPSTEMFRDPSLWRWLREDFFPDYVDKGPGKLRIWIPACVSGAELSSLVILLSEAAALDKVQIIATSFSEKSLNLIRDGIYDLKKLEVSQENYKRFNGQKDLSAYYRYERDYIVRNKALTADVEFKKINIGFDNAPQNVKLILFRNSLIYANPTRQEFSLQVMHRALSVAGHIALGIREKILSASSLRDFDVVHDAESIYRKKI